MKFRRKLRVSHSTAARGPRERDDNWELYTTYVPQRFKIEGAKDESELENSSGSEKSRIFWPVHFEDCGRKTDANSHRESPQIPET